MILLNKTQNNYLTLYDKISDVRNRQINVPDFSKIKKGYTKSIAKNYRISERALSSFFVQERIKKIIPKISNSKAEIVSRLKTESEIRKFSEKYDVFESTARDLMNLIKEWNYNNTKNPLRIINKEMHEFLLGTLLGDSSVRMRDKYATIRFSHSIKQKNYFLHKKQVLGQFNSHPLFHRKDGKHNELEYSSKTHPIFNYYHNLFYMNGKKEISNKILNQLTPRSIAYWVCDDGSYCRSLKYIILCTNCFSLKEHEIIKEMFKKRFNINPTIGFRDKKYYYLRFSKSDTEKLILLVRKYIPKCMKYKIGEPNE